MGEESMEKKALASCSSAAAAAAGSGMPTPTPPPADDFSAFLHQFILRSSSSSSSHAHRDPHHPHPHQLHSLCLPNDIHRLPPPVDGIHAPDSYFPARSGPHAPSSSLGASGNDTDDYDCESEGLEALLEDTPARQNPPRNSSKRSRTAQVHNLSEKRRRSKINEKMKALQSLIPNSNKTDKASMLDEAIEYLKQLQLQVQQICREDMLRNRQSNVDCPETSLLGGPSRYAYSLHMSEYETGARATVSLPFSSQPSTNVKLSGRDQPQR